MPDSERSPLPAPEKDRTTIEWYNLCGRRNG